MCTDLRWSFSRPLKICTMLTVKSTVRFGWRAVASGTRHFVFFTGAQPNEISLLDNALTEAMPMITRILRLLQLAWFSYVLHPRKRFSQQILLIPIHFQAKELFFLLFHNYQHYFCSILFYFTYLFICLFCLFIYIILPKKPFCCFFMI